MKLKQLVIIPFLLTGLSASAQEESPPPLSTETTETKETPSPLLTEAKLGKFVVVEGETKFLEVEKVLPGDVLNYVTTYSNTSELPLGKIKPEIKIPQGTLLEGFDKVDPAPAQVIIAGEYLSWPLDKERMKKLQLSEVEGFSWIIESLKPEEKKQFTVILKINK